MNDQPISIEELLRKVRDAGALFAGIPDEDASIVLKAYNEWVKSKEAN